jgi:hypothetical protein
MTDTIMTFTENELETIKAKGGDYNWVLNQQNAGNCKYLVCCHSHGAKRGTARTAFLVGLISKIVDSETRSDEGRAKICISEYAEIDIPDVWKKIWQNPFKYTSLEELGINVSDLKFQKLENKENSIMQDTVMTFTENYLETIKTKGGDYDWRVDRDRAGKCKYLVCCHSQKGAKKGTAFLVGLISKIADSETRSDEGRAKICISEYAEIDIPDVWDGWQILFITHL